MLFSAVGGTHQSGGSHLAGKLGRQVIQGLQPGTEGEHQHKDWTSLVQQGGRQFVAVQMGMRLGVVVAQQGIQQGVVGGTEQGVVGGIQQGVVGGTEQGTVVAQWCMEQVVAALGTLMEVVEVV